MDGVRPAIPGRIDEQNENRPGLFQLFWRAETSDRFLIIRTAWQPTYWQQRNVPTELMVGRTCFAMGIVTLLVSKTSTQHRACVDFIILANLLHSIITVIYAQTIWHVVLAACFIGAMGAIPFASYPLGYNKDFPVSNHR